MRDLYYKYVPKDLIAYRDKYKPFVQIVPMSTWHLYSEFEDGKPAGGRITFVWLFGIIGGFVLLLACINFMNLSTAQSEKRSKEVGVRKTIGSCKRNSSRNSLANPLLSSSCLLDIPLVTLSRIASTCLRKKDSVTVRQSGLLGYSSGVHDSYSFVGRIVSGLLLILLSTRGSAQGRFTFRSVCLSREKCWSSFSLPYR